MPTFDSDGIQIAYDVIGEGPLVVLLGGAVVPREPMWDATPLRARLADAGLATAAMDHRGQGASDKPADSRAYHPHVMAGDALNLMTHLGHRDAVLVGYSLGSVISSHVAALAPDRVRRVVLGGLGENNVGLLEHGDGLAEAVLAPEGSGVGGEAGEMIRALATMFGADCTAVAALFRGVGAEPPAFAGIAAPTMLIAGTDDDAAGAPEPIAAQIRGAAIVTVPGVDHQTLALSEGFVDAVVDFVAVTAV